MLSDNTKTNSLIFIYIPLLLIALLVYTRFYVNYLVFHSFAEYFTVIVGFSISMVTYYTYSFTKNRYLLFIGFGYFWISILDMMHVQTFPGMKLYDNNNINITLTLWVLTRLFEAGILLAAPFMRYYKYDVFKVLFTLLTITFLITITAMSHSFVLYEYGSLTSLKITFEIVVIILLLIALYFNKLYKEDFGKGINKSIKYSIFFTILAEISFIIYNDVHGIINLIGHIFKFLSYWVLLQAVIKTSLSEPFTMLQKGSTTYNAIPQVSVLVDKFGIIREANKASCETLGKNLSEIIGFNNHDLFHPTKLKESDCPVCKAIKNGEPLSNFELEDKQRKTFHEYSLSPIYINDVSLQGYVQVCVNVTRHRDLENSIKEQYRLIQNIVDTVPVRIFWKDKHGVYLGANKLFLQDAKLTSDTELIGKTDFDMIWGKTDAQSYIDDDKSVMKNDESKLNYEEKLTNEAGDVAHILTSKIPLKNTKNKIIGLLGTYQNITKMKDLEVKNRLQEQQLLQQSRLVQMGEMISMIAHQWRQPLAAIATTSINMKLETELEAFDLSSDEGRMSQREYLYEELNLIESLVQNLTTTIDDFRNFYKKDKELVATTLETVCEKALKVIKESLRTDNIDIIYDYSSDKKIKMYPNEIMQVVLNIFKNAQDNFKDKDIKKPIINIITTGSSISICDNGGGIQDEIVEKIFDPYFSTKHEKNGTGLGLYMSKIIVEDHHNAKLYTKKTDDGVCFVIEFNKSS